MNFDIRQSIAKALAAPGDRSSDFDLNPTAQIPAGQELRAAGVLVPIVVRPSGARLLLTKRAPTLRHHPGQIAFPGGKVDERDDGPIMAALREANEEIALPTDSAEIVGCLPPHETVTGFLATPVVAIVSNDFRPTPALDEVAEVFEVPFRHVLDLTAYSIQSRRWRGEQRHYFTVPWGPYYIWGATARMLHALADRMNEHADRSGLA